MDGKRDGLRRGYFNCRVFHTFCEVEASTAQIEFNRWHLLFQGYLLELTWVYIGDFSRTDKWNPTYRSRKQVCIIRLSCDLKNYADLLDLHNSSDHTQSHPVIANHVDVSVLHYSSDHTTDCVEGASHVFLQAARGEHAKGRGGACSEGHSFPFSTNSLTVRRISLSPQCISCQLMEIQVLQSKYTCGMTPGWRTVSTVLPTKFEESLIL